MESDLSFDDLQILQIAAKNLSYNSNSRGRAYSCRELARKGYLEENEFMEGVFNLTSMGRRAIEPAPVAEPTRKAFTVTATVVIDVEADDIWEAREIVNRIEYTFIDRREKHVNILLNSEAIDWDIQE